MKARRLASSVRAGRRFGLAVAASLVAVFLGCAGAAGTPRGSTEPLPDTPAGTLADVLAGREEDGVVCLVGGGEKDGPLRLVLARRCAAPPETVLDVVFDVARYDALLQDLSTEDVREIGPDAREVDVSVDLPLGALRYRLRLERTAGRVDVYGVDGALAGGRWSWRALPQGGGSLVLYASEAAFGEESGWFVESVLAMDPDLEPGLFFAQGLRFLQAVCREAERRAGRTAE